MYIIKYDMKWFDVTRKASTESEMLSLAWDFSVSEPCIAAEETDEAKAEIRNAASPQIHHGQIGGIGQADQMQADQGARGGEGHGALIEYFQALVAYAGPGARDQFRIRLGLGNKSARQPP